MHQRQARIAADDDFGGLYFENVREQLARFRQAFNDAVIAAVGAVGGAKIADLEQAEREIELLAARLAAGHVERELARLERVVARAQLGQCGGAQSQGRAGTRRGIVEAAVKGAAAARAARIARRTARRRSVAADVSCQTTLGAAGAAGSFAPCPSCCAAAQ